MRSVAALAWSLLAVAGGACAKEPAGGTRAPNDDGHCEDASRPRAYAFDDQAAAERAGCRSVRVYVQTARDSGPPTDDERWVFCCPKR
jgi:hypothetical protein